MSVLVVVEGLARQLAEEVGSTSGAAGSGVLTQRAGGGHEGLRAAGAAHTTAGQETNSTSKPFKTSSSEFKQHSYVHEQLNMLKHLQSC